MGTIALCSSIWKFTYIYQTQCAHRSKRDYTGISLKYLTGYNRFRRIGGTYETALAGYSLTKYVACAL